MYEDLIKRLRRCEQFRCRECEYEQVMGCRAKLNEEAAEAIEAQDRHILTLQHEMMAEAESHIAEVNRLNKQIEVLSKMEKATTRTTKRGSWRMSKYDAFNVRCSECGHVSGNFWNFCPNCGADMREKN